MVVGGSRFLLIIRSPWFFPRFRSVAVIWMRSPVCVLAVRAVLLLLCVGVGLLFLLILLDQRGIQPKELPLTKEGR